MEPDKTYKEMDNIEGEFKNLDLDENDVKLVDKPISVNIIDELES